QCRRVETIMQTNNAGKWDYSTTVHRPWKENQVKVKVNKQGCITKVEKILYTIDGVMLLVATYVIVSFASTTDALNRDIQSLEQEISDQQVANEDLLIKVEAPSEPARITRIAKENGFTISSEVKQAQGYNN